MTGASLGELAHGTATVGSRFARHGGYLAHFPSDFWDGRESSGAVAPAFYLIRQRGEVS